MGPIRSLNFSFSHVWTTIRVKQCWGVDDCDVLEKTMTPGTKADERKNMEQPSTDKLELMPTDIEIA